MNLPLSGAIKKGFCRVQQSLESPTLCPLSSNYCDTESRLDLTNKNANSCELDETKKEVRLAVR